VDVRLQVRGTTGTIVVLVDPSAERLMFPSRGACTMLDRVDPSWLDGVEVLHVTAYSFDGGSTPASVRGALAEHRRRGGTVSMDVSSTGLIEQLGVPAFLELMDECRPDVISANRDESRLLGLCDGDRPAQNLARFGAAAVLLGRQGKEATNVFRGGRHVATVPVSPVEQARRSRPSSTRSTHFGTRCSGARPSGACCSPPTGSACSARRVSRS
jgi:sugar/nucleoside kinase (ribokinase family)